jgi:hypothetical protein
VFDEVLPFYLDDLGVDGFRLDHVQGPSRDFWRAFDAELTRRWPETLVIGEVWAPLTTINSYGDVLDAATAFPLRERLLATFASRGRRARGRDAGRRRPRRAGPAWWFPASPADLPVLPRPVALRPRGRRRRAPHRLGLRRDPDDARAADDLLRRRGRPGPRPTRCRRMPTSPTGGSASRCPGIQRSGTIWDDDLLARVATFARARTTTPALHSGRYLEVVGAGDVWVFERTDGADRLLVALNNGEVAADLRDVLADAGWPDLDAPR